MKREHRIDDSSGRSHRYLSVAVIAIIASIMCSLTLWLLENPVKYELYILEVLLIIVLCIMLQTRYRVSIKFNFLGKGMLHSAFLVSLLLDIALISLSLLSMGSLTGIFSVENDIRLVLGLALISLLPGYALLNLIGLSQRFSVLENLVFSYLLSYSLTSLLTFIFNPLLRLPSWALGVCVVYLMLGLLSAVKSVRSISRSSVHSYQRPSLSGGATDAVIMLVLFCFFLVAVKSIFPQFSLCPGSDVSSHYMIGRSLVRSPDLTIMDSREGWFHLFIGCFYQLSMSDIVKFQTVLMILNFMPILAFYIMVKEYSKSIDERLPIISTIFYFLFSGLGWIYVIYYKLSTNLSQVDILIHAAYGETYLDTMYTHSGFFILGYAPIVVSFVIFFALIYLIRRVDLSRSKRFALLSLLFASCLLTHSSEAAFFVAFLALYALVGSRESCHARKALPSLLIGIAVAGLVLFSIPFLFSSAFRFTCLF